MILGETSTHGRSFHPLTPESLVVGADASRGMALHRPASLWAEGRARSSIRPGFPERLIERARRTYRDD